MLMTCVRLLRGEDAAAAEHVETMLALSASHGLTYWTAIARMFAGWVAARAGRAEGLDEVRGGSARRAVGPAVAQFVFSLAYADASLRLGETREGLRAADEALSLIARQEERG